MNNVYEQFTSIMNQVIDHQALTGTNYGKYLNISKNFSKWNKQIKLAADKGYKHGLDFGCGVGFAVVLGKLYGVNIVGLDIPNWSGKNPRGTLEHDGPSPFSSAQNKLIELGYNIVLRDTLSFPWNEFQDDQFDFVTAYFSITKSFGEKDQSFDFSNEPGWKTRIAELERITKRNGQWWIGPRSQTVKTCRNATLTKVRLCGWGESRIWSNKT